MAPTTVRLDAETDLVLRRLQHARRESRSAVIRNAIRHLAAAELADRAGAGPYQALAHLIGCVDSGGLHLSKRPGERFAHLLRERERARRPR